jgi:predicted ATPase
LTAPFLTRLRLREDRIEHGVHPFNIPIIQGGLSLDLSTPITFLVGENGSGKSTLLEAIAWSVGYAAKGGNRDHRSPDDTDGQALGNALTLSWRRRPRDGFFLRAETFFDFSTYLEKIGSSFGRYGGASFHTRSHGEAFLALLGNRFQEGGFFILDEPEAALSPQRQLALLAILQQLTDPPIAQFVIATHSPMLLAFPGATVLSLDGGRIEQVEYRDTAHFQLTRDFLNAPERFFRHLLESQDDSPDPS